MCVCRLVRWLRIPATCSTLVLHRQASKTWPPYNVSRIVFFFRQWPRKLSKVWDRKFYWHAASYWRVYFVSVRCRLYQATPTLYGCAVCTTSGTLTCSGVNLFDLFEWCCKIFHLARISLLGSVIGQTTLLWEILVLQFYRFNIVRIPK